MRGVGGPALMKGMAAPCFSRLTPRDRPRAGFSGQFYDKSDPAITATAFLLFLSRNGGFRCGPEVRTPPGVRIHSLCLVDSDDDES